MDLYSLLKHDHDEMERLLKQMISKPDVKREEMKEVQNKTHEFLNSHLQMEEKFLYPQLLEVEEARALIQDGFEEHNKARALTETLLGERFESDAWVEHCEKLLKALKHHAQEEEQKLFPIIRDNFKSSETEQIYRKMIEFREQVGVPVK